MGFTHPVKRDNRQISCQSNSTLKMVVYIAQVTVDSNTVSIFLNNPCAYISSEKMCIFCIVGCGRNVFNTMESTTLACLILVLYTKYLTS